MTGKERYNNIEIPPHLSEVIGKAQQRAQVHRRKMRVFRNSSIVAACVAMLITVNVPSVVMALSDVPIVGSIVKVLQVGDGGERTDGVSVTSTTQVDTLNIHFQMNGEQTNSAPAYTVEYRNAPNRLIFTFNGVREFNYTELIDSIKELTNIKDIYKNVILDDSAVRFVVELQNNIDYSISEYQKPGYIQLKLFAAEKPEKAHKAFYVRSQEMELGEMLAIIDEQYAQDGSSVIKTNSGKYIVAIGALKTQIEADELLRKLSTRDDYSESFHVDSWMSDENPL
ncbi:hypothetical protein ACP8HI_12305 [Paenibacillus sp. FA6]|uniref:hypothetical protein n=1 Tax=Paenibacillus sp. FA6 TaxID=3413029 RepID=UPI003F657A01